MRNKFFLTLLFTFPQFIFAQNHLRFENEVNKFRNISSTYEVVFTGSSSIRMWTFIQKDFPEIDLMNTGFGGSQMSDLFYYADLLILNYKPSKIFIYEGDNDIYAGKSANDILDHAQQLVNKIRDQLPETRLYFISAKPSPARWYLKAEYLKYNLKLKKWCESNPDIFYIDVWFPMLDEKGVPASQLFTKDKLHMNKEGYQIWKEVIGPYLD
jgi:GDSL-like lipase/acylhydrolase family protein